MLSNYDSTRRMQQLSKMFRSLCVLSGLAAVKYWPRGKFWTIEICQSHKLRFFGAQEKVYSWHGERFSSLPFLYDKILNFNWRWIFRFPIESKLNLIFSAHSVSRSMWTQWNITYLRKSHIHLKSARNCYFWDESKNVGVHINNMSS